MVLEKFCYSGEKTCLLLSAAPIEAWCSAVVDAANACAILHMPTWIFDVDIRPWGGEPASVVGREAATAG